MFYEHKCFVCKISVKGGRNWCVRRIGPEMNSLMSKIHIICSFNIKCVTHLQNVSVLFLVRGVPNDCSLTHTVSVDIFMETSSSFL